MGKWQPMFKAPLDGTAIQADIPGNGTDNIIAWREGLLDGDGSDCGSWHFIGEQEPPSCWTDGICWEQNEDGVASVWPKRWKPLPTPTQEAPEAARSREEEHG